MMKFGINDSHSITGSRRWEGKRGGPERTLLKDSTTRLATPSRTTWAVAFWLTSSSLPHHPKNLKIQKNDARKEGQYWTSESL